MQTENGGSVTEKTRIGFGYSSADGGRFLVHSRNIIVMFSNQLQKVLVRVVKSGSPREINEDNADQIIDLNTLDDLRYDFNPLILVTEEAGWDYEDKLSFRFRSYPKPGQDVVPGTNQCDVIGTDEGLMICLYSDADTEHEEIETLRVRYDGE